MINVHRGALICGLVWCLAAGAWLVSIHPGMAAEATLPLGERVGHTLVLGPTRVGKTRLAEVYITQDIHRPSREVVIVFDPKGDADLLKRMYVEARRAEDCLNWPAKGAQLNCPPVWPVVLEFDPPTQVLESRSWSC